MRVSLHPGKGGGHPMILRSPQLPIQSILLQPMLHLGAERNVHKPHVLTF